MMMANMTGFGHMGGFGYMGWFGLVFQLVLLVALIVGIVLIARWLISQGTTGKRAESTALETLKMRYARGEIDREEFQSRRTDLEG